MKVRDLHSEIKWQFHTQNKKKYNALQNLLSLLKISFYVPIIDFRSDFKFNISLSHFL